MMKVTDTKVWQVHSPGCTKTTQIHGRLKQKNNAGSKSILLSQQTPTVLSQCGISTTGFHDVEEFGCSPHLVGVKTMTLSGGIPIVLSVKFVLISRRSTTSVTDVVVPHLDALRRQLRVEELHGALLCRRSFQLPVFPSEQMQTKT